MNMWRAWQLDPFTWAWIVWIVAFVVIETWALLDNSPHDTLTYHLRPLFLSQPVLWFVAFGLWLWLGVHLLVPEVEARLVALISSPWST